MIHRNYAGAPDAAQQIAENAVELAKFVRALPLNPGKISITPVSRSEYEFEFTPVVPSKAEYTTDQIALWVARGNLAYGSYCVRNKDGSYVGKIYTA